MFFFYFRIAFDLLSHIFLMEKLSRCAIHGLPLPLFRSYLNSRKQCVVINNHQSTSQNILGGVLQESVLGPLSSSIFIDDILNIDNLNRFIIYAEDTILVFSANCVDTLITEAYILLNKFQSWAVNNGLKIPRKPGLFFLRQSINQY